MMEFDGIRFDTIDDLPDEVWGDDYGLDFADCD